MKKLTKKDLIQLIKMIVLIVVIVMILKYENYKHALVLVLGYLLLLETNQTKKL